MLIKIKIAFFIAFLGGMTAANAQDLVSSDFDNGSVSPFHVCTTQSPNYAKIVSGRLKTFWQESSYNGTRMTKGAEVCAAEWHTRKEGWYGMTMNLGPDYPTDKTAGVAQIFQFVNESFWTWAAMLLIDDGDLTILHRPNGGTSSNVEEVVYADFPKNQNFNIIMHFIVSQENNGELQVWVDGVSRYHKTNINFGFGSWDNNDIQSGTYTYVDLKAGQYNFDNNDYSDGETRTVYYDNMTWYSGSNGYAIVDPSEGSNNVQSPFAEHVIPGTIQAEDYDIGGPSIAYQDTGAGNSGSTYRSDNVDIQSTLDPTGGGYNVGWIANGEWLEYTVANVANGTYDIDLRVAASGTAGGKSVVVKLDGTTLGTVNFSGTNGWQHWATVSLNNVSVSGGTNKVLRLEMVGGSFNLNSIEFKALTPAYVATASTDDGNAPSNVLDNDPGFDTRWSANGSGQWLQIDMGSAQPVNGVEIAFFKGDQRNAFFNIQTSNNGSSWNTVLSGAVSSGSTTSNESFNFGTITARYIRYVGNGNSASSWNSLTDFNIITGG